MLKLLTVALGSLFIAGTLVAGAACGSTSSQEPTQVAIEVSCDDFPKPGQQHLTKEADLAVGQSLTLTLCSNPSTGFQWENPAISDPAIVQQVSHGFVGPESATPPVVGATGKDVRVFKGLKPGQSAVSLSYSRPWAGGEKGVWTYTLTVNVE